MGGTHNFGQQKGGTQKNFILKGSTEDFHKKNFLVFVRSRVLKSFQKALLPGHLDFHIYYIFIQYPHNIYIKILHTSLTRTNGRRLRNKNDIKFQYKMI